MSDSLNDFLAECDDVITDWQGSPDAARWTSDGSHEVATSGHYYGSDQIRQRALDAIDSGVPILRSRPYQGEMVDRLDIRDSYNQWWGSAG